MKGSVFEIPFSGRLSGMAASLLLVLFSLLSCQEKMPSDEGEDGNGSETKNFEFVVTNLKAGYVYVNFKPADEDMTYYFNLVVRDDAKDLSDSEIKEADLALFSNIAEQNGVTLKELLSAELKKGEVKWRFTGLMQSSDYTIYAYGIDSDGKSLTAVERMDITTPAVAKVDCSFEIVASNVQSTSFSVTISPSDDECAYFYDVFPAEYYEQLCGSQPDGIIDFLPTYISELAAQNSVDVPYTVSQVSVFGTVVDDFTSANGLVPASSYYVFAVGIGPDGTATTDPVVQQVVTAAPPANTFTLLQGSVGHSSATWTVSPSQSESYVALYERKCYLVDGKGELLPEQTLIDEILSSQGNSISDHIYSGNASIYECPLVPDENYCILVFGYFAGEVTTPLSIAEFHTAKPEPDTQQDFSIMSSEVTTESFSVAFNPYLQQRPFIANYMPMSKFEEYGGSLDDINLINAAVCRYNDEIVDELYNAWSLKDYADKKEFLHRRLYTDYVSYTLENLTPGTEYLCYAIGMTADGTYTTNAFVKSVTTKSVFSGPMLSEILPSKYAGLLYLYFYINTDSGAKLYGNDCRVNDSSFYDQTDDQIRDWFYEGYNWETGAQSPRRMWSASEYFTSVHSVTSGDVVYCTVILVGDDKDNYTIVRYTYTE